MGGRPITALNIVCFPAEKLGLDMLRKILQGGLEIMREAGVALLGGHSVEDAEPKYGLSVTGVIHPDKIMRNSGLKPGDILVLTKAVGTGLIAAAVKGNLASQGSMDAMTQSMCTLNKTAAEVGVELGVKACTDVTGFGLAGHLLEMARASGCSVRLDSASVPVLEGALDAASMGLVPAGAHSNRNFFSAWSQIDPAVSPEIIDLMFDPQTSGGLLLAIPEERGEELLQSLAQEGVAVAAKVGQVLDFHPEGLMEIV
jgi:selenide,water dikinase